MSPYDQPPPTHCEWRVLTSFSGYEVSEHGHVRSRARQRLVRPFAAVTGAPAFTLREGGRSHTQQAARLVAAAFLQDRGDAKVLRRIDGNQLNCHYSNLRWDTTEARIHYTIAPDGCWLWDGTIATNGYGRIRIDGRERPAHRIMYERAVGPIPAGLQLDHLCRVRRCVNPAHLEPVTPSENVRRSPLLGLAQSRKTHCPQGHSYAAPEHLYVKPDGGRGCRTCRNAASRLRRSNAASMRELV